jgi:hypothetical protein
MADDDKVKQTNYECPSIFRKTEEEKQEEAKSAAAGAEIPRVPIHHLRCKQTTSNQQHYEQTTVRPHFISGARLS